jgi:hypothetical protein
MGTRMGFVKAKENHENGATRADFEVSFGPGAERLAALDQMI